MSDLELQKLVAYAKRTDQMFEVLKMCINGMSEDTLKVVKQLVNSELSRYDVWRTRIGKEIKVIDLGDRHLQYCERLARNHAFFQRKKIRKTLAAELVRRGLPQIEGEIGDP